MLVLESRHPLRKRNHIRPLAHFVQVVGPCVHELPPWFQIGGVVVGGADLVAFLVSELQFDEVVGVALFVQDGGGNAPEAVARHSPSVAHAFEGAEYGVVGHGASGVAFAGKEQVAVT